eukprot:c12933_g1_i2.p1 GENE.c12933_g1_i2~~c12933_g1_i2.p1  ORF type:complete len:390 (-),score=75.29 c12933_g1_i2:315-1448(-)
MVAIDHGIYLAVISSLATAFWDLHTKSSCDKFKSSIMVNLARGLFLFPSFLALVWLTKEEITLDILIKALQPAIISAGLAVCSMSMQIRAYQISPISATVPFMSFQSVFAMFVSWVAMKEIPSQMGVLGVMIVTVGAFWLNAMATDSKTVPTLADRDDGKHEKLMDAPRFTVLPWWLGKRKVERGTLLILGTAFIFSFQSALDKYGTVQTGAFVYGAVYSGLLVYFNLSALIVVEKGNLFKPTGLIPTSSSAGQTSERTWFQVAIILRNHFTAIDWLTLWINSILWFVSYSTFLLAMDLSLVAYCVAIKRAGCLVTVVIGWLAFQERGFLRKFPAIVLMVVGVLVIVVGREMDTFSLSGIAPIALFTDSAGIIPDSA